MTCSSPTSPLRLSRSSMRRSGRAIGSCIAFCEGLTPGDLKRKVILDRREAGRFPETIAAILGHLYIHQIHHRGQVHAMLSGTSVAPPQLDEFFLDQDLHLRRRRAAGAGAAGNLAL